MVLFIRSIAKLFGAGAKYPDKTVACISNKYFLSEEFDFPRDTLKPSEINEMAKISIENMLPGGAAEMASGFFVHKNKSSMTVFIASKNRLLSEIPLLSSYQYWLPEKFIQEHISSEFKIPDEENCSAITINHNGVCSIDGKNFKLFSNEFWTAELHDEVENSVNKKIEFTNSTLAKGSVPLTYGAIGMLSFIITLVALHLAINFWNVALGKNETQVNTIMERSKLRDEALAFSAVKLTYLRNLKEINSIRPKEMRFTEFKTSGPKVVDFSGTCISAEMLNNFLNDLRKESSIFAVSSDGVVSKQNVTSFNIRVEFL
ncbi:MAG: hypothetical protein LBI81_02275 [Puniceicoccales bacterium]|jgi:hypothetical protein|nr:hypothetical protein [Puniceicoccales bacterium]